MQINQLGISNYSAPARACGNCEEHAPADGVTFGERPPKPEKCFPFGRGPAVATVASIAPATAEEVRSAVAANNVFTLDLHRELAGSNGGSFFLSPFNANTCMSMVLAGARGTTADGVSAALRQSELANLNGDRVHAAVGALCQQTEVQSEGVAITTSNRVFSQDGYPVTPEFQAVTRDAYGSEAQTLNFQSDPEGSRQTINGKVSEDTKERIPNLLPEGSVDGNTVVVLTSAIHFDGKWDAKFPEENDHPARFQSPEGPVDCTMMNLKKDFPYTAFNLDGRPVNWGEEPDVKVVELPYQGGRFSRLVFVPRDADGLAALESQLTPQNLEKWTGQMYESEVDVYFPKNEVRSKFELKDPLTKMGAGEIFESGADLSGIGPGDLKVSNVFHETWVKDNNVGTEFAAATGAVVALECMVQTNEVRADRPFFTLVKDKETGAILATQRVLKPEWTEEKQAE
ncbi:MAG: serpin family protein [Candidatus Eremiobacterota bacterium]